MKKIFTSAIVTLAAIAALTTTGIRPAAAEFNYATDCRWNMSKGMTDLPDDTFMTLIGDIDRNNVVDITDLSYLSLYLIGEETTINEFKIYTRDGVGNLNSDGVISLVDLAILRQFICHQITAQDIKDSYGNPAAVTTPAVTTPAITTTFTTTTEATTTTAVTTTEATTTTAVTTTEVVPVTTTVVTTEPEVTTTAAGVSFGQKSVSKDFRNDMDTSIKAVAASGSAESFTVTPAMNTEGNRNLVDNIQNMDIMHDNSFVNSIKNTSRIQDSKTVIFAWDQLTTNYAGNIAFIPGVTKLTWKQSAEYIYDAERNIVGMWVADTRVSDNPSTAGKTGMKSVRLYMFNDNNEFELIGARAATVICTGEEVITVTSQNRWFSFNSEILQVEDAEVFDLIIESDAWFDDGMFVR